MNTLQKSTHLWKTRLAPLAAPFGAAALRASARSFLFLALLAASFSAAPPAHAAGLSLPPNNLGLVGYWSFNEGSGSIAHDFSGNGNTGTLVNSPTWTTGKLGQALSFNGTSQYVNSGNAAGLQIANGTVVAWVKTTDTGVYKGIAVKQSAYGLFDNSGTFGIYDWGTAAFRNSGVNIADGAWHFVAATFQSGVANGTVLYVDGVARATTQMTIISQGQSLYIGYGNAAGQYLNGTIDDVRIYNRALSAAEVQALYQTGLAKLNSSHNNQVTNGLVGLWSFDGTDMSGTTAYDRSGSGNNGTLVGGPVPTIGRLGQALSFNGTSQYITAGSSSVFDFTSSPFTLSAWIYPTSLSNGPVPFYKGRYRSNGYYAQILSTGEVDFLTNQSGSNQLSKTNTGSIVTGKWQLLTITRSGTSVRIYVNGIDKTTTAGSHSDPVSSSDTFAVNTYNYAGYQNTYIMSGSIDDVRIYNRALSQADVTQLYDMGAGTHINVSQNNIPGSTLQSGLVGLWSFNGPDLTTTTAYDRSGSGNNGTLVGGPVPTIGRLGQALSFNGTSQYINAGNNASLYPSSKVTLSAWVYPFNSAQNAAIAGPWDSGAATDNAYLIYLGQDAASNKFGFYIEQSNGTRVNVLPTTTFNANRWYHVVGVADGSVLRMYINGVDTGATTPYNGTLNTTTTNFYIGKLNASGGNYFFKGKIDDVRIYNRALSASEVKQLYNLGR